LDRERRPRPYQPRDKTPWRPRPWSERPRIPRSDDSRGKTCEDGEQAARDLVHSYYRGDCNNVLNKDFHRHVMKESRRKSLGEDKIYKKCMYSEVERALERVLERCSTSATDHSETESVIYTSDPYCAVTTNSTGSSKISWRVFDQTNDPWLQDDDHETTIDVMHADKRPYREREETEIPLVKGEDYCLRIYKGDSSAYGSGTTSVKVSCFDEDEEETILAWMSMSGPTGQEHKQGVMCFRVTGTGGSDLIEQPFPKQPDIPSYGQPMDVVFAIDITDSMCRKDLAGLSWLDKTKDAVDEFLERMDTEASSSSMAGYVGWEFLSNRFKIKILTEDIHDVKEGVAGLDCNNEILKSHESGMTTALRVFDSSTRPDSDPSSKAIIFITDDNDARSDFYDCVEGASRGVAIYTVGYETSDDQGDWLEQQAECNGGFFRRSDGTSITTANIFDEIFDAINN